MKVGLTAPAGALQGPIEDRLGLLDRIHRLGIDHVALTDHISFHTGYGSDGLLAAAAVASLHDRLEVMTSVYLLPLRHPVLVARQLATLGKIAPGRFVFGIGVGGEDRNEVAMCGVDPATRGARCDESLALIAHLMDGEPVDYSGSFFTVERAWITPPPTPRIPIVVGGRSPAALQRAARFGTGWIGVYTTPERYAASVAEVADRAREAGRDDVEWQHGLFAWCSFGTSREAARSALAVRMEGVYKIPFEKFERYVPYGTAEDVAEFFRPYAGAGCGRLQLNVVAGSDDEAVEQTAEVRRLLAGEG